MTAPTEGPQSTQTEQKAEPGSTTPAAGTGAAERAAPA
jgi:hypothetical protein